MAASTATRLSLDDVRDSVKRVQDEGEKLVIRLRDDARQLVDLPEMPKVVQDLRAQADRTLKDLDARRLRLVRDIESRRARVTKDVQTRTRRLVKDLEARRDQIVDTLRERLQTLGDTVAKALGVADSQRVAEISREVTALSLRIADIERRLQTIASEAKASKKKKDDKAA